MCGSNSFGQFHFEITNSLAFHSGDRRLLVESSSLSVVEIPYSGSAVTDDRLRDGRMHVVQLPVDPAAEVVVGGEDPDL